MKKLKMGDVFKIPVSNEKTGYGQIIELHDKNAFIIGVFKELYFIQDLPNLEKILEDEILFLGYTMDALIYHKYWEIIGNNLSNLTIVKLPYYKLGTPPEMNIVNYKGNFIRKSDKTEFDNLEYETVVAPVRYENALKAFYKMGEWNEDYDRLFYARTLESIKIVEG